MASFDINKRNTFCDTLTWHLDVYCPLRKVNVVKNNISTTNIGKIKL